MKTFAILFTGAAALALSACGGTDDTADEGTDVTVIEEDAAPAPTVTETTVVREVDAADGDSPDSVTLSEDGVAVDVDSDGARVQADRDGASISVGD